MRTTFTTGLSFLLFSFTAAADNPVKMSGQARMDIYAQSAVGSISGGSASAGGGSVTRMTWLSPAEQIRTYSANWPIRHFDWSEAGISFLPQSNGLVTIDLLGPWEMSPSGTIYRQEVLWDAVTSIGTTITNGSFELVTGGGGLVGWINPWSGSVVIEHDPLPVDGTNAVNVWHDRRLQATLMVQAGVPVEIRAWVRARIPEGFVDNPIISDPESPAHHAARKFMRGVNFSNYFEAPAGEDWGGGPLLAADFDAVKEEGFDHVRLPVSWNFHTGPGPSYSISNALFVRVDAVVTGLMARGIHVLLNLHHFNEFYANPGAWTNKLYAIWEQLAAHYSSFPEGLAFEILNEPHDQATTDFMNDVYAHLVPRIRTNNPSRVIFVGPGQWNSISELSAFRLPANDSNLIVAVHNYEPFLYTHQGASWTGSSTATTNVVYPGPPPQPVPVHPDASGNAWVTDWFDQYNSLPLAENPCSSNSFDQAFRLARAWSDYYGRPLHVGEFGAYSKSDPDSRERFYREMRESMDRQGMGWASWDWKSGFYYWDRQAEVPGPGLRGAFFPQPILRMSADGFNLNSDLATGKKVILEQAGHPSGIWTGIHTQILLSPLWTFQPETDDGRDFFRLIWDKN